MHFWDTLHFGSVPWGGLSLAVWLLIVLALLFDYLNGFHDAANSVATVVSTRVLSPQAAVVWAAFFNFIAFLIFHLKVAATMGKGIIDPDIVDNQVIAATLVAACAWDIITWYWGLPTSSSHALIGGMIGAAVVKKVADLSAAEVTSAWDALAHAASALQWGGIGKTVLFIVLAPAIGMITGLAIAVAVAWLFRRARPRSVDRVFRRGQLLSAALYSLGHGGNDAQKTMGIIFLLLIAASQGGSAFATPAEVPTEVVLACHTAMGLGTLMGGWRIVKTMGQRIIKLRPVDGFCAEGGAATTLILTIFFGVPVSTTHTITGAIVGVGALKRLSAVRWGVAGRVVWAWVLTIPATAALAAFWWWLMRTVA
jgi:PiT family inorganic phosphate transporter